MTVSTHTYTATLLGSPNRDLPIKAGSISLDVSRFPHVEASLLVPVPDTSLLQYLDPRQKLRVRIVATANFPSFSQNRTFDLGLRRVRPNRATGDVELFLKSDEALLQDFGPLADDKTPRTHEGSIRALTNYVLSKIGATLQAGTEDANATAYWSAVNLIQDPRYIGTVGQWGQSGLSTQVDVAFPGPIGGIAHNGVHLHSPTTSDSYVIVGQAAGINFNMQAGKTYVLAATASVRSAITGTGPTDPDYNTGTVLPRQRALVVYATGPTIGGSGYRVWHTPQVPNTVQTGANASGRVAVKFTLPPEGVTDVFIRAYHGGTGGSITWSQFSLVEVRESDSVADGSQYFCGGFSATGAYTYAWRGLADASASERKPVIDRPRELFTWRAGVGGVDFLSPILQANGFRLVCDEERKWTLRRDGYRSPGQLTLSYGVNIIAADEETSRDDDDWYDAATYSYTWRTPEGIERTKDDSFALTGTPSKVIRREINREYPGPGRAEYAVRRVQGRGRTLVLESVTDWTAKAEQELIARLDGTPTQLGTTDRVEFELGTDRMRVSARTADTPDGAINLLPGTINSLPGTINSL